MTNNDQQNTHSLSRVVVPATLHTPLSTLILQLNNNKDENKSLISNQFSLKNDSPPPTSWRTILWRSKLKTIKIIFKRELI